VTLAEIVKSAVPARGYNRRHGMTAHPATKTFQALRIVVNNELENLQPLLVAACAAVKVGGRVAVISFHSGEDRIVKLFFKEKAGRSKDDVPIYRVVTKKPIAATAAEARENPPSRSAKLRVIERVG
jgi:16S rRNA (cytosine1402-N4)-methyltransferase